MNELELKEMIRSILSEITEAPVVPEKMDTPSSSHQPKQEDSQIEDGIIPDITEVDIQKQFLIPNAINEEAYRKIKQFTPARLGLWRAGNRYKTQTILRFRADHAAAQDAVFSYVSEDFVKEMGFIPVHTKASSKDEYLTRPDLGRIFPEDQQEIIKNSCKKNAKVQIVVGDGLSSSAIEANVRDFLPALKQGLKMFGLEFDEVLFIKHSRVGAMDHIAELTGAEVVCILIGERPGLVTAESMSAYLAYKPTMGMPESRRTVVSNIHKGGTPAVEAGAYVAEIIKKILDNKKSGVDLK
ncbi:TPA: ethanolamine ammonia-lyase subunit EutC [Streptococcus suis]|uniref:Ethanolamine ammonia-lyase small subunit n=1 Tax=Streptococcus suis TaxID=1307 RepID=A0A116P6S0_STRSU|nr:ethanolamine ammonia-lyase subunit EutC [Streptococcus suis]MCK3935791.1 ethanolamine ammonia-lyase subunit EutC [Streptococcus suis]MCQ8262341.1 ethanolamine ammonia-lyase subunit EutC [Streptococcus suis]MDW8764891.1 ethanolamine ammonia-lyase subunit EutC [Streptococcus suis]NQG29096.1 ethanolamine ammonia-lyase subunit EutC [Streptococcus suis]NQJ18686.1 ethanolamine ammonia-lyase subunit EutC [Streptococcus suis]